MSVSPLRSAPCPLPPGNRGNGSHTKVLKVEMLKSPALPSLQQLSCSGCWICYRTMERLSACKRRARNFLEAATKKENKQLLHEPFKASSRREVLHLAAASLGFLSLLLPESAEARTRNADIRRKILEKLEELREKAGLSKPKVEAEENKSKPNIEAEEKNRKPKDEIEGKKTTPHQSTAPPSEGLPLPLPSIINGKTVETNLP